MESAIALRIVITISLAKTEFLCKQLKSNKAINKFLQFRKIVLEVIPSRCYFFCETPSREKNMKIAAAFLSDKHEMLNLRVIFA